MSIKPKYLFVCQNKINALKKIKLTFFVCVLFNSLSYAQATQKPSYPTGRLHFYAGLGGFQSYFVDLGLYKTLQSENINNKYDVEAVPNHIATMLELGGRLYFSDNVIINPNMSINFVLLIVEGGISANYYTDFKKSNFAITPNIGLSLGGGVKICYEYNAFFSRNDIRGNVNPHTFCLRFRQPYNRGWHSY